jgi:hypothetical protein
LRNLLVSWTGNFVLVAIPRHRRRRGLLGRTLLGRTLLGRTLLGRTLLRWALLRRALLLLFLLRRALSLLWRAVLRLPTASATSTATAPTATTVSTATTATTPTTPTASTLAAATAATTAATLPVPLTGRAIAQRRVAVVHVDHRRGFLLPLLAFFAPFTLNEIFLFVTFLRIGVAARGNILHDRRRDLGHQRGIDVAALFAFLGRFLGLIEL